MAGSGWSTRQSKQKAFALRAHPLRLTLVPSLLQEHDRDAAHRRRVIPGSIAVLGSGILLRSTACIRAVVAACMATPRDDSTLPAGWGTMSSVITQTVGAMFRLAFLLLRFACALPSTNRPNNAVPESRQEGRNLQVE
jgi:hypothetical protein